MAAAITRTPSARYAGTRPVIRSLTRTTARTTPIVWLSPDQPDTAPRWVTGTRSGTRAVTPACMQFSPAWATHQAMTTPRIVCWPDSRASPAAPAIAPPAIHGRRRPNREPVASDRAPAAGPVTSATAAPIPVTMPSLSALCALSMSCTWLGSSTCSGPM